MHPLLVRQHYDDQRLRLMAKELLKDLSHRGADVELVYEDMTVMSDFELHRLCGEKQVCVVGGREGGREVGEMGGGRGWEGRERREKGKVGLWGREGRVGTGRERGKGREIGKGKGGRKGEGGRESGEGGREGGEGGREGGRRERGGKEGERVGKEGERVGERGEGGRKGVGERGEGGRGGGDLRDVTILSLSFLQVLKEYVLSDKCLEDSGKCQYLKTKLLELKNKVLTSSNHGALSFISFKCVG